MLTEAKTLLLVDDEPSNLQVLRNILSEDYRLLFARDGDRALELARSETPDLILLDVMMPGRSGYDVCEELKAGETTQRIPVIFVTSLNEIDDEARGFELGAVDYITKPVSAAIVRARIRNHLSLVRVDELVETRLAVVQRLGRAAEYKDNETGLHVIRMSHYAQLIAVEAGMNAEWTDTLLNAAAMHDVGKIGIPDAVLQKPGKLDAEEWAIMQRHAEIGAQIIGEDGSDLLAMAQNIALCHHEKWDGTGYPKGLEKESIPYEARVAALADVFDALTSERPYKKAWSVQSANELIQEQRGKHFDPDLVDAFFGCQKKILAVRECFREADSG